MDNNINRDLHPDEEFLKLKVEAMCLKAQKKMNDDAISGAKKITLFLAAVLSLFTALAGTFGYNTYTDITEKHKFITDKAMEISTIKANVVSSIENAEKILESIRNFKLKEKFSEINSSLVRVKKIEDELSALVSSIKEQKALIKSLRNGALDISVHYVDKKKHRREGVLKKIEKILSVKGYWVNPDNVLNYSADVTEVIYYNVAVKPHAEEVAEILSTIFVENKVIAKPNYNDRIVGNGNILIKIANKTN